MLWRILVTHIQNMKTINSSASRRNFCTSLLEILFKISSRYSCKNSLFPPKETWTNGQILGSFYALNWLNDIYPMRITKTSYLNLSKFCQRFYTITWFVGISNNNKTEANTQFCTKKRNHNKIFAKPQTGHMILSYTHTYKNSKEILTVHFLC